MVGINLHVLIPTVSSVKSHFFHIVFPLHKLRLEVKKQMKMLYSETMRLSNAVCWVCLVQISVEGRSSNSLYWISKS